MSAYTDNATLMQAMGIAELEFKQVVQANKAKVIELILFEIQSQINKKSGKSIIGSIVNDLGVLNAGGYDNIARENMVPPKHVIDLYEEFKQVVMAMDAAGEFE